MTRLFLRTDLPFVAACLLVWANVAGHLASVLMPWALVKAYWLEAAR